MTQWLGRRYWVAGVFRVAATRCARSFELNSRVTLGRTPVQADLLRSTVDFCAALLGASRRGPASSALSG